MSGPIFTSVFCSCNIALVKPFELLGQTISPDGSVMKLIRRGDEYLILVDGAILMSNRMHGSEEALATFGCQRSACLGGGSPGISWTSRKSGSPRASKAYA